MTTMLLPTPVAPASQLQLRPASDADADAIVQLYEGLSAASRYTRFFRPMPRIDSALRSSLTDLAAATVWLAFDDDVCVGEARIVRSARQPCADLAITIADGYQGQGLGARLARRVVRDHFASGDCVSMSILPTNTAAARLARRSGIRLRLDDGALEGSIAPQ